MRLDSSKTLRRNIISLISKFKCDFHRTTSYLLNIQHLLQASIIYDNDSPEKVGREGYQAMDNGKGCIQYFFLMVYILKEIIYLFLARNRWLSLDANELPSCCIVDKESLGAH